MNSRITLALSTMALLFMTSSATIAKDAMTSYKGDPDVYKLIFENKDFRVIAATRKKGVRDKVHMHPVPSVIYFLTDCVTRLHLANGKSRTSTTKAGTVRAVPFLGPSAAHAAENVGSAVCKTLFVERK